MFPAPSNAKPIEIFISYAHEDEQLREEFEKHLALLRRARVIKTWNDRQIIAGDEWDKEIDENLKSADIILLLISPDFLASEYSNDVEVRCAMDRHRRGEARVIPVILRHCDWTSAPFGALQALPPDGQPVLSGSAEDQASIDRAFTSVAVGIRKTVEKMATRESGDPNGKDPTKPKIDFLPYLCDRDPQESILIDKLPPYFYARQEAEEEEAEPEPEEEQEEPESGPEDAGGRRKKPRRPFVCIVHGEPDQDHDMFRRRLQEVTLPELLKLNSSIVDFLLPLPSIPLPRRRPFDFLDREIGRAIADDASASKDDILKAVAKHETPLLFHSYLDSQDWEPHGPDLVTAFLKFWKAFPDLPPKSVVLSLLFFKYRKASGPQEQALAERNRKARAYFDALYAETLRARSPSYVVLPELTGVRQQDVEIWIRSNRYFRGLCPDHVRSFCNISDAIDSIQAIYERPEFSVYGQSIPMKPLAKELVNVLNTKRC